MKTNNARFRVNSVWRDITEISLSSDKIVAIANNGDKFEFTNQSDSKEDCLIISIHDLFQMISDNAVDATEVKPKKRSTRKETVKETED